MTTEILRDENNNVVGMRAANTLRGIAGGDSTAATQAETFNTDTEAAKLSEMQLRGVQQSTGGGVTRITASNDVEFSEGVHLTRAAGGTPILDGATAKSSDICQVGDLKMSIGAAAQLNLIEKKGSDWQLTREGTQMVANRAGRQIEQLEAEQTTSCLDHSSQVAMSKLDNLSRGKFSAYLPSIMSDYIDSKPVNFEIMQKLSADSGASPELLENMMSEIANKALDTSARMAGEKAGMTGAQVHNLIQNSSKAVQKRWLTSAVMGDTKGIVALLAALRRKDIS